MNSTKKAPIGKQFHLEDGRVLSNVKEMLKALETMSDEVFRHHVNSHRNDFSNWVDHVFGYKELARGLKRIKTREGTVKKVKAAIVEELKNKVKNTKATAKKTTKKVAKKPAKSVAKKTTKKPAKSVAKKTSKKVAKKTSKK